MKLIDVDWGDGGVSNYFMTYCLRLSILSFLACTLVLTTTSCGYKPTDEELKAQFYEHKTEINSLLKMQLEDSKVIRISPTLTRLENDWSWPRKDIGFSKERWGEYRRLFILADIQDGLSTFEGNVFFLAKGERGFAFLGRAPADIRKSFADCLLHKKKDVTCFVPLENNWHLFIG